jgi:hypothetical protein
MQQEMMKKMLIGIMGTLVTNKACVALARSLQVPNVFQMIWYRL